jgi:3-dehydroquinate dehydratase/shikimate dehydrogenase
LPTPVRHSISPAVHNRAFQSKRVDAVYLPFLVSPACLRDFFSLAAKLPLAGFSVTIPHKQKIIRYLDVVDPLARRIGAVNTVWRKAGKWRGTNTDAAGVTGPLSRLLQNGEIVQRADRRQRRRRPERRLRASDAGAKITSWWAAMPTACAPSPRSAAPRRWLKEQLDSRHFDAVVHATPLGMFPHVNECFFDGTGSPPTSSSTWCTTRSKPCSSSTPGAGQDRGSRAGHVHRTGRAPVRNLDRRNRAALRHAEGRAGGALRNGHAAPPPR